MNEPTTIDEMLAWFDRWAPSPQGDAHKAIRTILEQHRNLQQSLREDAERMKADIVSNSKVWWDASKIAEIKLAAIRAFVERVKERRIAMDKYATQHQWWQDALMQELAAMEGEAGAGTNDR